MKILVWNECYVAGGADWSLIDLVTHWPTSEDSFVLYVNRTHEGLNLLREKIQKDTELILLKGKQAKKEIIDAEFYWKTNQINDSKLLKPNFNTYKSLSNSKSFVVVCTFA